MKIRMDFYNNEVQSMDVDLPVDEILEMDAKGFDIGSLFALSPSSKNEEDDEDFDDDFFWDEEFKKNINPPEKEETKFLCHTANDIGYGSEKTGFVKSWLDQHNVSYEKCEGTYSKYIKYELTASQLKELTDLLIRNDHLARGVFI